MKATEKSTSRRTVLTALAAVPIAGATAQAATVECPELQMIYGEMLAISAEWNATDTTDEQGDRYSARLVALAERIIATPAETLADVVLKLRVFRRYERDMPMPPKACEELWQMADSGRSEDRLLCSIARDIYGFAL
jgi:hypothetical protein